MFHNIKLNNVIDSNDSQLRPLKLVFKIQFGKNIRVKNKLIKTWIKNTKNYKKRRKIGYVKTPNPRYHYKVLKPSLKFYKFMFLKFKSYKNFKINFFFKSLNLFKNLNQKKIFSRAITVPNFKKKSKKKIKRLKLFSNLFKFSKFSLRARRKQAKTQRRLAGIRRKFFSKLLQLTYHQEIDNVRGKIFFVNSWITFYHKLNLKKLKLTVSKKEIFNSGLKKFIKFWKKILNQKLFCIYSLYSLYIFKSVFLKKKKRKNVFFYNKENILLISISYNHFSFFVNLLSILKLFFNDIFLKLNVKRKKKLIENNKISRKFVVKAKNSKMNMKFFLDRIKLVEKKLRNLLKINEIKAKKKYISEKIKALDNENISEITKKDNFFKFKTKTFFYIFYLYCFFVYLKKKSFLYLKKSDTLKKNIFFVFFFSNILMEENLEEISFFNFILENNLLINSDFFFKQKLIKILYAIKLKKNNFNEISFFFRSAISDFFFKEKIKTLRINNISKISFFLNELIKNKENKTIWKNFFVLKQKKISELKLTKKYLRNLYFLLFLKSSFNKKIYVKLFNPYNAWLFYINYSLNYYLFSKLYFAFLNYFFYIIFQKFHKISHILKLNKFELCYDFIKSKENSRYHLGIRPHTFVTTFNRRVKKGFLLRKF